MSMGSVPTSKVAVPHVPPHAIRRPSLQDGLLAELGTRPVVLLCAPSGYGKTTLLAQALRALPGDVAVAWITVQPGDTLSQLIGALAAALEPYDLPWRTSPESLAGLRGPDTTAKVSHELAIALWGADVARGVVVLDDVHELADPQAWHLLDRLTELWPERWTLVLSTQVEPPLALSRALLHGRLLELRQDDLRFQPAELSTLSRTAGRTTTPAGDSDAAILGRLIQETDGWPVAVGLWLHSPGPPSAAETRRNRRLLLDYLATEVLFALPDDLREFLMKCSVLEEWTPRRCAALTGDPRAGAWLAEIERRGLFVAWVEAEEFTLKPHELFRSFLRDRLLKEQPELAHELLAHAAAQETVPHRRVQLLLLAGDYAAAQATVDSEALRAPDRDRLAQVLQLYDLFPPAVRDASPTMALARSWESWTALECGPMLHELQRAEAGFLQRGETELAEIARAYRALALFMLGRLEESDRLAAGFALSSGHEVQALSLVLEYCRALRNGPVAAPAGLLDRLASWLSMPGTPTDLWFRCAAPLMYFVNRPHYAAALERFLSAAEAAAGDTHLHLSALVQTLRAGSLLLRGDWQEARRLMQRAQEDCRWLAQPPVSRRLPVIQVLEALLDGRLDEARAACAGWLDRARHAAEPRHVQLRSSAELAGRLASAAGAWDLVQQALAILEAAEDSQEGPLTALPQQALQARMLLHDGRADDARRLLRPLLPGLEDRDRLGFSTFVRACLAAAEDACGDSAAAGSVLAPLALLLQETRQWGDLWVLGHDLLQALDAVAADHVFDEFAAALRAGIARAAPPQEKATSSPAPALRPGAEGAQLTVRETQVLDCLAIGDSNKVIARKLGLSPHTVKRHVARILDRLGASTRGQAASLYSGRPLAGRR
jgi:LuxR family maltose regulon positive regulatory protein